MSRPPEHPPLREVTGLSSDHAPGTDQPLRAYGALMGTFFSGAAAFAVWLARSGRAVPAGVAPGDLALVSIASHKAARLVSRDRVTSVLRAPFTRYQGDAGAGEVDDAARGTGLRLALGELLICPYCIGMWIAAALTGSLLVWPRFTRWVSFALTAHTIADFLQIAYRKAEDAL